MRDRGRGRQRGEHGLPPVGPRQPQAAIPCSQLHRGPQLLRRPPRPISAVHRRWPQPRRHPLRWAQLSQPSLSLSLSPSRSLRSTFV